jgi:hypothetical protein
MTGFREPIVLFPPEFTSLERCNEVASREVAVSCAPPVSNEIVSTRDADGNAILVLSELCMFSAVGCRDLSYEMALTSPSMANLLYLDISYTAFPTSWTTFCGIRWTSLRVLKLRGLGILDEHLYRILGAVPKCLWSLDLRDNYLTQPGIITDILPQLLNIPVDDDYELSDYRIFEEPPAYQRINVIDGQTLNDSIVPLRPDSREEVFAHICQHGHLEHPSRETLDPNDVLLRETGLTHLYLSENPKYTGSGINSLISSTNRLQVLDVGSIRRSAAGLGNSIYVCHLDTPRLLHTIDSGTRLEILRIHHSIVTYTPTYATYDSNSSERFASDKLQQAEDEGSRAVTQFHTPRFDPCSNFRLQKLTLTGLPTKSYGFIITQLKLFLSQCAKQESILQRARLRPHNRRSAPLLPGLRALRLEFTPISDESNSRISVSGHEDADSFLAESAQDFSFFDKPEPVMEVKETAEAAAVRREKGMQKEVAEKRLLDVVEELKEFRKTTKEKWTGKLELVFPYGR